MKREKKSIKTDNKGMTLIDLLCTIAIFSCLMAAVSGVLVVVAKTYRGGTTETTLQQESQFTANLIGGLIVSATDSVNYQYYGATGWEYADSEVAAMAAGASADEDRRLEIVNDGGRVRYEIYYRPSIREITYIQYHSAGMTPEYTIAEDVTCFAADVSEYDVSNNVIIDITMERDSKQYTMSYNMTSRNGNVSTTPGAAADWAIILTDTELVMEPCQELVLPVEVQGTQPAYMCYLTGNSSSLTTAEQETNGIRIKLDKEENGNSSGFIVLTIRTTAYLADGITPLALKHVFIRVRRVEDIGVSMVKDNALSLDFVTGTTYTAKVAVTGNNLNKKVNNSYDEESGSTPYKNPYFAQWSWEFTVGGVVTSPDAYFEFTPEENVIIPSLKIELKQNMPSNSKLTVTVAAKHPEGTIGGVVYNKTGSKYDTIKDTVILECVSGSGVPEVASPFKRGEPHFFYGENLDISKRTSYEGIDSGVQMNWFWRFREVHDDGSFSAWTQYYKTMEGGSTKKINEAETECFLPDKAYQIEYICAVYNPTDKKLYWPHDDSLLLVGTGFAEEGYSKEWMVNDTPEADYKKLYSLGKVEITFKANAAFGVNEGDKSFGTLASPVQLSISRGITTVSAQFNAKYIRANNGNEGSDFKDSFIPVYEQWNGTAWVAAVPSGWQITQHDNMNFQIRQTDTSSVGLYRIGIALKSGLFKEVSGTLLSPVYTSIGESTYPMYDAATGEGYIYLQCNP